jgi:DNA-binding MurR/RpiR family transcriptional regulator
MPPVRSRQGQKRPVVPQAAADTANAADGGTAKPPDVISELRKGYDQLTQSQKRIAEAIVEDPEFVAFATVDKMAARLGVSPSTVVRFAYRIGLNGYQELQDRVRTIVRQQMRSNAMPADGEQGLTSHLGDTVYARSFEHDLENLRRTILGLSLEDLDRAVGLLVRARRVFVIGGMTSHSVAYFAALALDRVRGDTQLLAGDAASAAPLLSLTDEDALLVFTFPPYASGSLRTTNWARRQGAKVIAVTDTPISPVGQRVDIVLPAPASGMSTQNSFVAAMTVANALLNGVVAQLPGAMERYGRIMELLDDWDVFVLKGEDGAAP